MPIFCVDLKIDQGGDFSYTTPPWVVNGVVQDLTGRTCRFAVYAHPYDAAPMLALTSAVTSDGSVVCNGTAGTSTLTITNASTSKLIPYIGPLKYVWFVDVSDPVTSVTITDGGTGYTTAPTVSFSGGGGSNAAATATVASGIVTSVVMSDIGSGYTSAPAVGFTGGGGSSAAATAVTSADISEVLQAGKVFINATIASA